MFLPELNTSDDVSTFLKDNFPQLSGKDLKAIKTMYPLQKLNPFPNRPVYFASGAAAVGDTYFVCPTLVLSTILAQHTKIWNYR